MKKGDSVMLAIFVMLLASALFAYAYLRVAPAKEGRIVTVSMNGQIIETLRLDEIEEPFRRVYKSAAGFNTVYVDKEGAAVVEADCQDQHCVRTGRISTLGVSSICLPHRFILRISDPDGSSPDSELDGGTY